MANIGTLIDRFNPIRFIIPTVLLCGIMAIAYLFISFKMPLAAMLSILPASVCVLWFSMRYPAYTMLGLFVVNYFIMGIGRMLRDVPIGTLLDALIFYNIAIIIIQTLVQKVEWRRARTSLTLVALLWTIYCILEVFNPNSIPAAWVTTARSYAFYFLSIVILTQVMLSDFKYLRYLLVIWAVLTLIAVAKALYQKYVGFTDSEKYWLYVLGASRTHIIYSGIRYFSFFSDAANFGGSMGVSMVVFSISALYTPNKLLKYFLLITAMAACYGLLISGTRSALAVPFAGYAGFICLSRNFRMILIGMFALVFAFAFLNFTSIGNGNSIIRRARSAFNTEDASFQVRLDNQAKLRELMADKPFGTGLGLGGGKAKQFAPNAPISQIPTDSWFVLIWVETGVVGLLLHICVLLYVLGWGSYQVVFRIRSPLVKGYTAALICGIAGLAAMSYANEVFGQIPNSAIVYMSMAFIFLSPHFDRQMLDKEQTQANAPTPKA